MNQDNAKTNDQNAQINDIMELKNEDVFTVYTNSVNLAFGYYDFQFLFREQYPSFDGQGADSINFVRLVMSPQHAKIFNMILEKNIKQYEENFGEINVSDNFLKSLNLLEE
ncbi:DUF3467 domain-containing protein [Tepidimicrobium xylanilyticum]|uniref:DUF3467 domain-containing protein n=1 Tax=Tepidimicrobium xylanilyticum TaxID=1123352 RepID=A0A1H3EKZ3_9FIRM|nr:DUF3467 domain-containing protein [Tepidimicrobium xylanilyticum]GMG96270.1 hypothetical protein EN5CB1_10960 [Tepidimicrobium xylanilyticum]SDX79361.1 Protein of unknown function [Tepidimicrobium xylanilyticum]